MPASKKKTKTNNKQTKAVTRPSFKRYLIPAITTVVVSALVTVAIVSSQNRPLVSPENIASQSGYLLKGISLPTPDYRSATSVELAMKNRRTKRSIIDRTLSLKQISQSLWAMQGVTADWGGRTAPSAKSTYSISIHVIINNVEGLKPGQYRYLPGDRTPVHELLAEKEGEMGKSIFLAVNQSSLENAPAVFIITGDFAKMASAYSNVPHDKEVYLEAGHVAQNLLLQSESQKLGVVPISTFDEGRLRDLLTLPDNEAIIYVIPIGYTKD